MVKKLSTAYDVLPKIVHRELKFLGPIRQRKIVHRLKLRVKKIVVNSPEV